MKRVALMGLLILSVSLLTGAVWAGEVTTTFQVSATVPQAVTVTAYDLDFGTVSFTQPTDQTTTIEVTAQNGLTYQIGLGAGTNCSGGSVFRCLDYQDPLNGPSWGYELYQDSSHSTKWGDSCVSSPTYGSYSCEGPFTGSGTTQTYDVYGRVWAPPTWVSAGTYTDTITVTVVY